MQKFSYIQTLQFSALMRSVVGNIITIYGSYKPF